MNAGIKTGSAKIMKVRLDHHFERDLSAEWTIGKKGSSLSAADAPDSPFSKPK